MLGGITLILYGMIGLVGAKIWVENGVDFGNPVNLVGLSAGLIAGIGGVSLQITDDFELSGIASARSSSSSTSHRQPRPQPTRVARGGRRGDPRPMRMS